VNVVAGCSVHVVDVRLVHVVDRVVGDILIDKSIIEQWMPCAVAKESR
jgi:hypothetical protein